MILQQRVAAVAAWQTKNPPEAGFRGIEEIN
jgi:hypothetical protein